MLTQINDAVSGAPPIAWATGACLLAFIFLMIGRKIAPKTVVRRPDRRKNRDNKFSRHRAGFLAMGIAGAFGLYLSLNTSIRFGEARLNLDGLVLWSLGVGIEAIVVALAIWSWAFNDAGAARVGYILVLAQAIGAWEVATLENGDAGIFLYRLVGPIILAYALHKLLKIEAKLGKIDLKGGLFSKALQDAKNRLEARLGIGGRGADAEAIARKNAADKYVALNTRGKRRWWESKGHYGNAMVKAGRGALNGLEGAFREFAEGELADRIAVEKGMKEGAGHLDAIRIRGVRSNGRRLQADAATPDDASSLTSAATPAAPDSRGQTAPEPHDAAAEPNPSRELTAQEHKSFAFRIYADLENPSGRAFLAAWRKARTEDGAKLGLSDKDVAVLYKEMDQIFNRAVNGNTE